MHEDCFCWVDRTLGRCNKQRELILIKRDFVSKFSPRGRHREIWFYHSVKIFIVSYHSQIFLILWSFFKKYLPWKRANVIMLEFKGLSFPFEGLLKKSASDMTIYNIPSLSPCRANSLNALSPLNSSTANIALQTGKIFALQLNPTSVSTVFCFTALPKFLKNKLGIDKQKIRDLVTL